MACDKGSYPDIYQIYIKYIFIICEFGYCMVTWHRCCNGVISFCYYYYYYSLKLTAKRGKIIQCISEEKNTWKSTNMCFRIMFSFLCNNIECWTSSCSPCSSTTASLLPQLLAPRWLISLSSQFRRGSVTPCLFVSCLSCPAVSQLSLQSHFIQSSSTHGLRQAAAVVTESRQLTLLTKNRSVHVTHVIKAKTELPHLRLYSISLQIAGRPLIFFAHLSPLSWLSSS